MPGRREGEVLWETSDTGLLTAIGPEGPAQHYTTVYATSTYVKCNDKLLFFAGPQRTHLVAVNTADGSFAWQKEDGNTQLVLREDVLFAAGRHGTLKLDYETGDVLARFNSRGACTRATGSVDAVFFRAGGTMRIDVASDTMQHISPMRPPCQDGVLISDGMLYWGPWMCGCALSLYGHIGLAPAGDAAPDAGPRLELGDGDPTAVAQFAAASGDWPSLRGDNHRTFVSSVPVAGSGRKVWAFRAPSADLPTAPVTAGDTVFVGDRNGTVFALDAASGDVRWQAHTDGPIFGAPAFWNGRLYVGSGDGRVYAHEAATGRLLWRFRVAPQQRLIPVYDRLMSTWPVAGGVVVEDGVLYAAAGIASYDGTHVYALDAVTGEVKWHNGTSGEMSTKAKSGISLQGELYLADGELRFGGGNVYGTARYDLETGKCLNEPQHGVHSPHSSAFYAHYPRYGRFVRFDHTFDGGDTLSYDAKYDGSQHANLALLAPFPEGTPKDDVARRRINVRPEMVKRKAIWQKPGVLFGSFILAPDALLAAGQDGWEAERGYLLAAIDVEDGSEIWQVVLPAAPVKDGTAVDHTGRVFVSLADGQVLCFASDQGA